jgi:glycosyltransferase involved in cell wall biosynthesis
MASNNSKKKNNKFLKKIGGTRNKLKSKKTQKNYPLITVIMPNYKSKSLSKAIKSVLNQTYGNVELIVIDGGSGDSAIKIFKKFDKKIDYWISEKDKGMWDAWNKGFKLAKGKFVGVVDSSNILYPKAMKILSNYIINNRKIDFVCGTVIKDGKILGGYNPEKIFRKFDIIPSSVVGFFIKRSSLKKVGYLNLKYKIQSDYDLLYRMIVKHNLKGIHTKGKEVFGNLGNSGFSTNHSYMKKLLNEVRIRINNRQNILSIFYLVIGRSLKKIFYKN